MELVRIPAGEFQMGSGNDDVNATTWEKPRHRVRITRSFYLGKFEVTRGQFTAFVQAKAYRTEAEKDGKGGVVLFAGGQLRQDPKFTWRDPGFAQTDERPVLHVNYNDAVAFCAWLSAPTRGGRACRCLPRSGEECRWRLSAAWNESAQGQATP